MQDIFKSQLLKSACGPKWKKIGIEPHHGIVLMVRSLHSKNSCGGGEFLDLLPLLPWCKSVGLDFIQLLPLTDSGFDNSPYNPVSTLALNPTYLSLYDLPFLDNELKSEIKKLQSQKKTIYYNYSKTRGQKFEFLRKYFAKHFEKVEKSPGYKAFVQKNAWVKEYALFCALCSFYGETTWSKWPKDCKNLTPSQKEALYKKHDKEMQFFIMSQFFCSSQLQKVHEEAKKHKVYIFGDLPFLVSKESCAAWRLPDLFMTDYTVGSPPDDLTPDGQEWNFPAYNWDKLRETDYAWWKERLKVSENYFDFYRLDHIIGFFRTWNIPHGKKGKDGHFCPEDPNTWLDHGKNFLLKLINSSDMLPIGEDLVIPQTVKDVLRELGICGTNILTWQRTGAGGLDFVPYPLYVAATITHLASHDTVTLAQWWNRYSKVATQFCLWNGWKYTKTISYEMRLKILHDSHHTSSLFHANLFQEYLALFPEMVHKSYNQERINYPGTPSKLNWRYRFVPSVEEITTSRKLRDAFKKIVC